MAKLTKASFIKSLKEMKIKEVMELVDAIKEEFGINPSVVTEAPSSTDAGEVEKTEVTITLKAVGGQKVQVIKAVKEITGVGLMDAKKLVDGVPSVIKGNIKSDEAEEIKIKLEGVGAEVSID